MYKIGDGYSQTNMGGEEVKCPLCLGKKEIKPLHEVVLEEKKERPARKTKTKRKEAVDEVDNSKNS